MNEYDIMLEDIKKQEKEIVFTKFDNEVALDIGMRIIKKAKQRDKAIAIDITRNGQQIFHYSFNGTSQDNNEWINRKNKVVNRFSTSSLYIGTKLKKEGKSLEEKYHIDSTEYAPYGGAFPMIVKDIGVIGTITVSGMRQVEDHDMVVETLREYLNTK